MPSTSPFCLSIETAAGARQHGFHLGTDERLARKFAEEALFARRDYGVRTVALMRDGLVQDVFDGTWMSQTLDRAYD